MTRIYSFAHILMRDLGAQRIESLFRPFAYRTGKDQQKLFATVMTGKVITVDWEV